MKNIDKLKLKQNSSIKDALKIIDKGALQIGLIVDENDKLIGTITDGDIRRGILNGLGVDDSIQDIVCYSPITANISQDKNQIINAAILKNVNQIPIIDENGKLLGIEIISSITQNQNKPNQVVLMVGGLGTRLRPLTKETPKPMLPVGNKPILQTIIEKFKDYGYINITLCVNYKSDIIKDFFKNGSDFGVKINYIYEQKRLGTAGALSLIDNNSLKDPFFVMNGDLLTNVNFEFLHDYHTSCVADASMCVREYDFQVPYGVVNLDQNHITSIEEKPIHKFFVSAGIYMLNPNVLEFIPKNTFFDMPTLFEKLISAKKNIVSFPLREYWLDIGVIEEYKRANLEYTNIF